MHCPCLSCTPTVEKKLHNYSTIKLIYLYLLHNFLKNNPPVIKAKEICLRNTMYINIIRLSYVVSDKRLRTFFKKYA